MLRTHCGRNPLQSVATPPAAKVGDLDKGFGIYRKV
jgi:hypothetical protein